MTAVENLLVRTAVENLLVSSVIKNFLVSFAVRDLLVSTVVRDLLVSSGVRICWLLLASAVSFAGAGADAVAKMKKNETGT